MIRSSLSPVSNANEIITGLSLISGRRSVIKVTEWAPSYFRYSGPTLPRLKRSQRVFTHSIEAGKTTQSLYPLYRGWKDHAESSYLLKWGQQDRAEIVPTALGMEGPQRVCTFTIGAGNISRRVCSYSITAENTAQSVCITYTLLGPWRPHAQPIRDMEFVRKHLIFLYTLIFVGYLIQCINC
jgi:hypothetical protein